MKSILQLCATPLSSGGFGFSLRVWYVLGLLGYNGLQEVGSKCCRRAERLEPAEELVWNERAGLPSTSKNSAHKVENFLKARYQALSG